MKYWSFIFGAAALTLVAISDGKWTGDHHFESDLEEFNYITKFMKRAGSFGYENDYDNYGDRYGKELQKGKGGEGVYYDGLKKGKGGDGVYIDNSKKGKGEGVYYDGLNKAEGGNRGSYGVDGGYDGKYGKEYAEGAQYGAQSQYQKQQSQSSSASSIKQEKEMYGGYGGEQLQKLKGGEGGNSNLGRKYDGKYGKEYMKGGVQYGAKSQYQKQKSQSSSAIAFKQMKQGYGGYGGYKSSGSGKKLNKRKGGYGGKFGGQYGGGEAYEGGYGKEYKKSDEVYGAQSHVSNEEIESGSEHAYNENKLGYGGEQKLGKVGEGKGAYGGYYGGYGKSDVGYGAQRQYKKKASESRSEIGYKSYGGYAGYGGEQKLGKWKGGVNKNQKDKKHLKELEKRIGEAHKDKQYHEKLNKRKGAYAGVSGGDKAFGGKYAKEYKKSEEEFASQNKFSKEESETGSEFGYGKKKKVVGAGYKYKN